MIPMIRSTAPPSIRNPRGVRNSSRQVIRIASPSLVGRATDQEQAVHVEYMAAGCPSMNVAEGLTAAKAAGSKGSSNGADGTIEQVRPITNSQPTDIRKPSHQRGIQAGGADGAVEADGVVGAGQLAGPGRAARGARRRRQCPATDQAAQRGHLCRVGSGRRRRRARGVGRCSRRALPRRREPARRRFEGEPAGATRRRRARRTVGRRPDRRAGRARCAA